MTILNHVAVLVPSVEASAKRLAQMGFATNPPEFWDGEGTKEIYVGNTKDERALLLLVEPTRKGSYQRALDKRGPGVHHIAIDVDDLRAFIDTLSSSGWMLLPQTIRSIEKSKTAWLANSKFPALIEVQERSDMKDRERHLISKIGIPDFERLSRLLGVIDCQELSASSRSTIDLEFSNGLKLVIDEITCSENDTANERDLNRLPADLPVPQDDGACDHLSGMEVPGLSLRSTNDRTVNLATISQQPTVLFFYPRTGEPGKPAPANWDLIPGARGCTPQSCSFRDLYSEFKDEGYQVFGVSQQDTEYQKEFVSRNHIPFEILSDIDFKLTDTLRLPTFIYNEMRLIKRMALVLDGGKIVKIFYPVFPPDKNAETVLNWIKR